MSYIQLSDSNDVMTIDWRIVWPASEEPSHNATCLYAFNSVKRSIVSYLNMVM